MTVPAPTPGTTIAILGSCVTRDAFELPDAAPFELGAYMARTALGSFMGRRTEAITPDYERIASPFQRRMVAEDIAKQGRLRLRNENFDLLVIDLIDERLPVARFPDGGIATVSNEFRQLGIPLSEYTKIHSHTEESWQLWSAGWETLIALLDQLGTRDRLVVHRAHWAGMTADGRPTVEDPDTVAEANRWLDKAYEHMVPALEPHQFLEVAAEHLVAASDHRWGLAPFHYVPEYYRDFLARLQQRTPRS